MTLRHVALLVGLDLRRRVRSFVADSRRFAVAIVVIVLSLLPIGLVAAGAYRFGAVAAAGGSPLPPSILRGALAAAVVVIAAVTAVRAIQTTAVPDNLDGLLLAADHREVVAAVILSETAVVLGLFGTPGTVVAAARGAGAGSAAVALPALLAVHAIAVLGVTLGLAAGFGVRNALARSRFLARYRTAIGFALLIAYFGAVTVSAGDSPVLGPVAGTLAATPLGWYGDLAFVGLPGGGRPLLAAGALGLTVVGAAGLALACGRLAALLWYVDPVEGSPDRESASGIGDLGHVPRPVARVVRRSWVRAWRSPVRLSYVVYPAFLLVTPLSEAVETGRVPPAFPALVAVYGAWSTGAAFTLNVIGDEGVVLPVTLTAPVEGRAFVGGCCLAGVLVGLPVTAVATVASGVAAGLPSGTLLAAGILALTLPVGATGVASGIGATFPRTEAVRVTRGREAIVPSLIAFALYSLVLVLAAAPGVVVQVPGARQLLAEAAGLTPGTVLAAGTGLAVGALGLAGGASFRYAAQLFDRYDLD